MSDCEWRHWSGDPDCAGEAEYLVEFHGKAKRVCLPAYQIIWRKIRDRCLCRKRKYDCWEITPIEHVEATA